MYRTIDTGIWNDPWFAGRSPQGRYVFLQLITNHRVTPCGVFEITLKAIAFETGLSDAEVTAALAELQEKVTWWEDLQVVWVRNFYRRQRANSNDKFAISARRALAAFPAAVQQAVSTVYPELMPSPPHPPAPVSHPNGTGVGYPSHTNKVTVTETVTGSETVESVTHPPRVPAPAHEDTHARTREGSAALPSRNGHVTVTPPSRAGHAPVTPDPAWEAVGHAAPAPLHTRAGRPPVPPLPKPTQDPETLLRFDAFWSAFPGRPVNGPKVGRAPTLLAFAALPPDEQEAACVGALHYRAGTQARENYALDPLRWLTNRDWLEWQAPEPARPVKENPYAVRQQQKAAARDAAWAAALGSDPALGDPAGDYCGDVTRYPPRPAYPRLLDGPDRRVG